MKSYKRSNHEVICSLYKGVSAIEKKKGGGGARVRRPVAVIDFQSIKTRVAFL